MVSTPKAPDPTATAAAQGAINKQTAIAHTELNNQNQVTPYGSISYTQTGTASDGTPQFTATKAAFLREPREWSARATSSLPTPLSPATKTVVL